MRPVSNNYLGSKRKRGELSEDELDQTTNVVELTFLKKLSDTENDRRVLIENMCELVFPESSQNDEKQISQEQMSEYSSSNSSIKSDFDINPDVAAKKFQTEFASLRKMVRRISFTNSFDKNIQNSFNECIDKCDFLEEMANNSNIFSTNGGSLSSNSSPRKESREDNYNLKQSSKNSCNSCNTKVQTISKMTCLVAKLESEIKDANINCQASIKQIYNLRTKQTEQSLEAESNNDELNNTIVSLRDKIKSQNNQISQISTERDKFKEDTKNSNSKLTQIEIEHAKCAEVRNKHREIGLKLHEQHERHNLQLQQLKKHHQDQNLHFRTLKNEKKIIIAELSEIKKQFQTLTGQHNTLKERSNKEANVANACIKELEEKYRTVNNLLKRHLEDDQRNCGSSTPSATECEFSSPTNSISSTFSSNNNERRQSDEIESPDCLHLSRTPIFSDDSIGTQSDSKPTDSLIEQSKFRKIGEMLLG